MFEIKLTGVDFGLTPGDQEEDEDGRMLTFVDIQSGIAVHVGLNGAAMDHLEKLQEMDRQELDSFNEKMRRKNERTKR